MIIYTIIIIDQSCGDIDHIETYSDAKQAEERAERLEQIWGDKKGYLMELRTTQVGRKSAFAGS